jgi:hypothetical protein
MAGAVVVGTIDEADGDDEVVGQGTATVEVRTVGMTVV